MPLDIGAPNDLAAIRTNTGAFFLDLHNRMRDAQDIVNQFGQASFNSGALTDAGMSVDGEYALRTALGKLPDLITEYETNVEPYTRALCGVIGS